MRKSLFYLIAGSAAIAILVLFLAFNSAILWPWFEPTNVSRNERGSLVSYISEIERNLVSSGYQTPTTEETVLIKTVTSELLTAVVSGQSAEFRNASYHASRLRYEIVRYTDLDYGTIHYILIEQSDNKRGYGVFIINSVQSSRVIIEAPHPQTDLYTGSIGIRVYANSNARAFLMASARMDAGLNADVSHESQSFFEAVHEALVSQESIVIQIHGFSIAGHPGYPDVVISSGTGEITGQVQELGEAFSAGGFSVGVFDGHQWSDLSGTQSVQGKNVNLFGAVFIHVELELVMRTENAPTTVDILSRFAVGQST